MKCGKCSLMFFTFAKKRKKKKITPAGALQHETFQLKCNFHPHCWGMKPGKRQKMGYDRKDAAVGGGMREKLKAGRREGREDERRQIQVFDTPVTESQQGRKT